MGGGNAGGDGCGGGDEGGEAMGGARGGGARLPLRGWWTRDLAAPGAPRSTAGRRCTALPLQVLSGTHLCPGGRSFNSFTKESLITLDKKFFRYSQQISMLA